MSSKRMDPLEEVVGHTAVKDSLKKAVEQGRVSHAYLFVGPSAVGKFMVARAFAASLICPEGGCGACGTCRRVLAEKHPDLSVIRPAGKNIPVETIREVRLSAFRKPVESDRKVYIFKNAERMWEEGASTLLKVLEDPPGNVVFILVTASEGGVLPTIRSRCQVVRFSMVPPAELRDYLVREKGVSEERADLIARLTGGVLGRALDWCDDSSRLVRRDNVIRVARALRRADLDQVLESAQELLREVRAPVEELAARYQEKKNELTDGSIDDALARKLARELDEELKREQVKEEIRGIKEILSALSWWYRDILVTKEGGDSSLIVNVDLQGEISEEAEATPTEIVLKCIDVIGESMKAAELNVPAQLNIESTLLGIQEALCA